jgi:hypothetical protein
MATDIKSGIDALAAPAPPPGEQYQIAAYADRTAIREAMERFKAGLRVKDATEYEYAALAHVALKYDLDPFNGDAWIIPGHGVALGIKGLRKLANRQSRERGIRWWTEFHDVRNNEEAERYGIPTNGVAVAKLCVLRRSDLIEAYVETLRSIREIAGDIPFEQLQAIIGTPPIFTGVGYVLQGEKSKMPYGQLAMKRAETHAIRQAFDVEYRVEENEPDTDITVERPQLAIEPDATEGELIEDAPEMLRETAARISASLYGSDDDTDLAPPSPSIVTQGPPSPSIVTQGPPSPSIVTQGPPSPSIVTQARPVEGEVVGEGKPEPKAHWIDNPKARAKFWVYTKNDLGLEKNEVYEALGVKSIRDFDGTMQQAKDLLDTYADALHNAPPDEPKPSGKPTAPKPSTPPPWDEGYSEPLFPDEPEDIPA